MKKSDKEEYYRQYSNIYQYLIRAYTDSAFINAVDYYVNQKKSIPKNCYFIFNHLLELNKADLCLCICKIYYDKPNKGNVPCTINSLRDWLRVNNFRNPNIKASKLITEQEDLIKSARDHYISHNNLDGFNGSIQIETLNTILSELQQMFNKLYYCGIDKRVMPFKEFDIFRKANIQKTINTFFDNFICQEENNEVK